MTKTTKEASSLRRLFPLFRREEGQAAFEFVLILPFFVFFLLLLIDFGIMMYEYVSVSNAVREGARYGAVNCGDGACTVDTALDGSDGVRDRVLDRSGGILGEDNRDEVTVVWPDGSTRGDSVVVKVDHDYDFLFFPNDILGIGEIKIPVVSCADMRLEQTDKAQSLPSSGSGCQ